MDIDSYGFEHSHAYSLTKSYHRSRSISCVFILNHLGSFLREEMEITDETGEDIDLADLMPKVYEPVRCWNELKINLMNQMKKMNEEIRGNQMDLVFFKDAMIHVLRVRQIE